MNQEAQLDKIVEQHRAADVDSEYDERITDADYPEPEPKDRINPAVALGSLLADLVDTRRFDGLLSFRLDTLTGKPEVQVTSRYFNSHLADNWVVTVEEWPAQGCIEKSIDFEPCKISCIENNIKFVRAE